MLARSHREREGKIQTPYILPAPCYCAFPVYTTAPHPPKVKRGCHDKRHDAARRESAHAGTLARKDQKLRHDSKSFHAASQGDGLRPLGGQRDNCRCACRDAAPKRPAQNAFCRMLARSHRERGGKIQTPHFPSRTNRNFQHRCFSFLYVLSTRADSRHAQWRRTCQVKANLPRRRCARRVTVSRNMRNFESAHAAPWRGPLRKRGGAAIRTGLASRLPQNTASPNASAALARSRRERERELKTPLFFILYVFSTRAYPRQTRRRPPKTKRTCRGGRGDAAHTIDAGIRDFEFFLAVPEGVAPPLGRAAASPRSL